MNLAAGIGQHKLSHDEVGEVATRVRGVFQKLLERLLGLVIADPAQNQRAVLIDHARKWLT